MTSSLPVVDRVWYLVRHGETEWNAIGRMQGQLDSVLTSRGREQALASAALLQRFGVDTLFASPLGRVRETLDIMRDDVPIAPVFDDRLKEWSSGAWSGQRHAEVEAKWPIEWAAWKADRYNYRSPGGENFIDLIDRARAFFSDTLQPPGHRTAIVAHGFMNRALAAVLLSLEPEDMLRIRQGNDTIIRVVGEEGARSVDHFVGAEGPFPGLPVEAPQSAGSA